MALAPLGFSVDTKPVAAARNDLHGLTSDTSEAVAAIKSLTVSVNAATAVVGKIAAGTTAAAASVQKMTAATERARQANDNATAAVGRHAAAVAKLISAETRNNASYYADRAADIAAYGSELDQLRAKFNPVFAASKAYETELDDLNRAQRLGAITAAEHGAALVALNGRYQMAAGGAQAFSATAGMARMQTANLGYQIQDIGMMMAMGQSPFMLLAQQLPQITMYGGKLTGVMGALKSTLTGLFSPLGLLTTGFVLAGSAAISYFSDSSDDADAAADALAEQISLIQSVADEWGHAMPALKAYSDELERQQAIADRSAASQAAINNSIGEAEAAYSELRAVFADFRSQAETGGGFFDIEQASAAAAIALDEFADAMRDGELSAQEYRSVNEALSDVLSLDVVQANANVASAIEAVIARLMAGAQAARTYAEELAAVNAGGPIGGERVAAGKGNRTGAPPLSDTEFASRFGWGEYFDFPSDRKNRSGRGRRTDEERAAERYDDLIRSSEQFIASQLLEQEALYMTEEAAAALRYEQELLFQAANDNIKLTPEMTAELRNYAQQMAETEAETRRLVEQTEFFRDLSYNAFMNMIPAIETGNKALDNLLNTLIEVTAQALLLGKGPLAGLFGSGGGLLSGLAKGIGGGLGGGGSVIPWSQDIFRARGGPVSAGQPYIVGEERAELFVPDRSGTIVPFVPTVARAQSPATVSQPSRSETTIRLVMPTGWRSEIVQEARSGAQQDTVRIVEQYDDAMPDRISQIQQFPRRR
jgi:hypothetical protein